MTILHICTIFTDGLTYQENLLTKYMVRSGNQVYVIAPPIVYDQNGQLVETSAPASYSNEDGVHVIRLKFCTPHKLWSRLRKMRDFSCELERINPDIIFLHNPQTVDATIICNYISRNPKVRLYVDSHTDFSNSATNWLSKKILHGIIWKHYAQKLQKYAVKFYGVLPARVNFLKDVYGISDKKAELLVMGGDDDLIAHASIKENIDKVRAKYHVDESDFLIVTGGKIDLAKRQTLLLLQAISEIKLDTIKLLVFGSIDPIMKDEVNKYIDNKRIIYAGWQDAISSYELFGAAQMVVFPGRHSVYWEQVVSQGIPMMCKLWNGTTHVDIGGNVIFLEEDSSELIKRKLLEVYNDEKKYNLMKEKALSEKRSQFMYSEISRKSIDNDINIYLKCD